MGLRLKTETNLYLNINVCNKKKIIENGLNQNFYKRNPVKD